VTHAAVCIRVVDIISD